MCEKLLASALVLAVVLGNVMIPFTYTARKLVLSSTHHMHVGMLPHAAQLFVFNSGQATVEGEVTRLVATLTSLISYKDADTRILSLQCLASVMDLPYHLLHPLRKQVLAAVIPAVDDNKRRVRQHAVKCLNVWTSGP